MKSPIRLYSVMTTHTGTLDIADFETGLVTLVMVETLVRTAIDCFIE